MTILLGDCRETLRTLDAGIVRTCVTSPPYWGLRDYGTAKWEGGADGCDHVAPMPGGFGASGLGKYENGLTPETIAEKVTQRRQQFRETCGKCGARRIDSQIGLEKTPEAYVAEIVAVFREVRRVLADDGTLWLNLGDSYAQTNVVNRAGGDGSRRDARGIPFGATKKALSATGARQSVPTGLKQKDLVGIPWRVAFALQADGWYLRSDIIWAKPNPMPESVTDRPTKAHEYVFLLSKGPRYFYDAGAIAEAGAGRTDMGRMNRIGRLTEGGEWRTPEPETRDTRNARTVWTIPTQPTPDAHFATFPEALAERCILAGSQVAGKRCDCNEIILTPTGSGAIADPSMTTGRAGMNRPRRDGEGTRPITRREQRGHAEQIRASAYRAEMEREAGAAFAHYVRTDASGARPIPSDLLESWTRRGWLAPVAPCNCPTHPADTVIDPFFGSGTVGKVAERLGRKWIGCELNPKYVEIAKRKTAQMGIFR